MLGLLLKMIRDGDHRAEHDPSAPIPTGYRFVRGTHSGTYVEDPAGVDPLPAYYDFRTRATGIYDRPPVEEEEATTL